MNTIFKIISFPITFVVGLVSAILLLVINWDIVRKVARKELTNGEAMKTLSKDFENFILNELWEDVPPILGAFIAGVIYYLIFF